MAARCLVEGCDWDTQEPVQDIAGCMATWHIYEKHPEIWKEKMGDRPPIDPDPRDPVQRFLMERN